MKRPRYVFWKYDLFPYVLWEELESLTKEGFTAKGYAGRFKRTSLIGVLSKRDAEFFINELQTLKSALGLVKEIFRARAEHLLKRIAQ